MNDEDETLSQQKSLKSPWGNTVLGLEHEAHVLGLGIWNLSLLTSLEKPLHLIVFRGGGGWSLMRMREMQPTPASVNVQDPGMFTRPFVTRPRWDRNVPKNASRPRRSRPRLHPWQDQLIFSILRTLVCESCVKVLYLCIQPETLLYCDSVFWVGRGFWMPHQTPGPWPRWGLRLHSPIIPSSPPTISGSAPAHGYVRVCKDMQWLLAIFAVVLRVVLSAV